MKTAVVEVIVPQALKNDFEAAAAARGQDLNRAVRQLMAEYVEKEKERVSKREQTINAVKDVDEGRTVEGEKVMEWLSSWGSSEELEPPS